MSQVTIYLDPELEKRVRAEAEASGRSLSAFIADALRARNERLAPGFWNAIDTIADFPLADEIRASESPDAARVEP